jgi:mRNA interferase ChpB
MATTRKYVPQRGDIVLLTLDPTLGHEQRGTRPALVISPAAFNRFSLAMVCPITRGGDFARGQSWTVPLMGLGLKTEGVVLANQARILDWTERRAKFIETAPDQIATEVIARVTAILE